MNFRGTRILCACFIVCVCVCMCERGIAERNEGHAACGGGLWRIIDIDVFLCSFFVRVCMKNTSTD